MAVRKTESRIPGGFTLENAQKLGYAVADKDENEKYILVSYLDEIIRFDESRENVVCKYVLFVNEEVLPIPEKYEWKIYFYDENNEACKDPKFETTYSVFSFKIIHKKLKHIELQIEDEEKTYSFDVSEFGLFKIVIEVKPKLPNAPILELTHQFIGTFQSEDLVGIKEPICKNGDPYKSLLFANDLRYYILAAIRNENADLSPGGINSNLLLSIIYFSFFEGLFVDSQFDQGKDVWEKYLNDRTFSKDLYKTPVGISKILPHLLAMYIKNLNDLSKLIDEPVRENQNTDTYLNEVFKSFNHTDVDENNRVDIYNLLRFPKSSVTVALIYLKFLKNSHGYEDEELTKENYEENAVCIKTIVSAYSEGPMKNCTSYTNLATQVYGNMYGPYISAFSENELFFTKNTIYRRMMTNEFHKDGEESFHTVQSENFLKRLTQVQRDLLFLDSIKTNRLTAFIIFGDGFAERLTGGHFNNWHFKKASRNPDGTFKNIIKIIDKFPDNIRPNASFSLFNKVNEYTSELVFYTRFFCISYYSGKDNYPKHGIEHAFEARLVSRLLMNENIKETNEYKEGFNQETKYFIDEVDVLSKDQKIKKYFEELSYMKPINDTFSEVTDKPENKYYLSIMKEFGKPKYDLLWEENKVAMVPYITVKDEDGKIPRFMTLPPGSDPNDKNTNTIHGSLNTKGCWTLLRNQLWNWPEENKLMENYNKLSKISASLFSEEELEAIFEAEQKDLTKNDLKKELEVLRGAVLEDMTRSKLNEELKKEKLFKYHNEIIKKLELTQDIYLLTEPNSEGFKSALLFENDSKKRLLHAFDKGWLNLVYFEFVNRFLEYPYGKEDKYYYSFPSFKELDREGATGKNNIFKKLKPDAWIKNCKYIKNEKKYNDWADLYLFKRTDRFTKDDEDIETFK
ncbi:MAG: hypothetical protein K8S56_00825 [Candidatus Cloacimonetes bacterium]|nr:hypothetical protein [Candidatus Cloacimonadota bacterium]